MEQPPKKHDPYLSGTQESQKPAKMPLVYICIVVFAVVFFTVKGCQTPAGLTPEQNIAAQQRIKAFYEQKQAKPVYPAHTNKK